MPDEVIAAFPSPLDLQFRWAQDLSDALETNAVRVMAAATELGCMQPKPSAKQVLQRLVAAASPNGSDTVPVAREYRVGDKIVGSLVRDRKGGIALKIKGGVLQPGAEKRLLDFIDRLLPS